MSQIGLGLGLGLGMGSGLGLGLGLSGSTSKRQDNDTNRVEVRVRVSRRQVNGRTGCQTCGLLDWACNQVQIVCRSKLPLELAQA